MAEYSIVQYLGNDESPDGIGSQFNNINGCYLHQTINIGPSIWPVLVTFDLNTTSYKIIHSTSKRTG